jgi:hypothetical protein
LANLQEFMRHFNISYTSSFNKRHNRAGHLYQGRYKSFLIDADSYLLDVSRYIHLNPVRTKERSKASSQENKAYLRRYQWSSYIDYTAENGRYPFLSLSEILAYFSGNKESYARFVESGITRIVNPLEQGKGLGIVGDRAFIERIMKQVTGPLKLRREQPAAKKIIQHLEPERILQAVSESFHLSSDELLRKGCKSIARGMAMELLYRQGGMNGREIGDLMGVDYSAVSVARKRLRASVESDEDALRLMKEIEGRILESRIYGLLPKAHPYRGIYLQLHPYSLHSIGIPGQRVCGGTGSNLYGLLPKASGMGSNLYS